MNVKGRVAFILMMAIYGVAACLCMFLDWLTSTPDFVVIPIEEDR